MWVVEGDFDKSSSTKKLLKPGKTYRIGRRPPAEIVVARGAVSQETFAIVVGPFSTEDVADFSSRPSLTVTNKHASKKLVIKKPDASGDGFEKVEVEAQTGQLSLEDGDEIELTSLLGIRVKWHPTEFSTGPQVDGNELQNRLTLCAEVGVHLSMPSRQWVEGSSHLCTPQAKGSPLIMMALANAAHIVTTDYLDDFVSMGRRSLTDTRAIAPLHETTPLEKSFDVPDVLNYEPIFAGDLESKRDASIQLQSKPERKTMLLGATGLFIHADEAPPNRFATSVKLFKACSGRTEVVTLSSFDFSSPAQAMRSLSKYQTAALSWFSSHGDNVQGAPDRGLVILVVDPPPTEPWYRNLVDAAREMEIRMPDDGHAAVAGAVYDNDPRKRLNCEPSVDLTQAGVPSTEGSAATNAATVATSPPTTATAAPAQSTAASAVPSIDPASSVPAPTAATAGSAAPLTLGSVGNGQQHRSAEAPAAASSTTAAAGDHPASTAMGPPKPRRRAGEAKPVNTFDQLFGAPAASSSQAITQDTPRSQAEGASAQGHPATQEARPQPRAGTKRHARTGLSDFFGNASGTSAAGGADGSASADADESFRKSKKFRRQIEQEDQAAARGESEESASRSPERPEQSSNAPPQREPAQAPRPTAPAEDAEMEGGGGSGSRSRKAAGSSSASAQDDRRKAASSQVIRTQKGPRGKGAGEQPDSEPMFLQALKKTKSKNSNGAVDDFDREFNNLRLTKPKQKEKTDEDYEAWQQLDDFGDAPIGNFVRVDFVPLLRAERHGRERETVGEGSKWQGLPNFKRFRPKGQRGEAQNKPRRQPIAMDLTEGQDFGLGGEYGEHLKPKLFGLRELEPEDDDSMRMKPRASQAKRGRLFPALEGSSDGEDEPQTNRRKARGGATRGGRGGGGDEDDDDEYPDLRLAANVEDVDLSISRTTTRPSTSRNKARSQRAATQIYDDGDESDDDFGGRRKTASKRGRAQRDDDDDDDDDGGSDSDGGFKGFGRRTTKVKRTR